MGANLTSADLIDGLLSIKADEDSLIEAGHLRPEGTFSVYIMHVLRVRGSGRIRFYVGHTGEPVETRHAKHFEPTARVGRARIFTDAPGKADLYAPGELARDLMVGFPTFRRRETSERAEGYLADRLIELGYPSESDQAGRGDAVR